MHHTFRILISDKEKISYQKKNRDKKELSSGFNFTEVFMHRNSKCIFYMKQIKFSQIESIIRN